MSLSFGLLLRETGTWHCEDLLVSHIKNIYDCGNAYTQFCMISVLKRIVCELHMFMFMTCRNLNFLQ